MNITASRSTEGTAAPGGPSPALLAALTTEHYTLQSARSSTIVEANGRSILFLSTVSGATVALALVAQLDRLGPTFVVFALAVLPVLLALGLTSYARLADLAVHDAYYARAIGRIRSFYLQIEPTAAHFWLLPGGDDAHAVMRQTGQRHSRWHHLSHTATAVAVVTAAVGGVLAGLGVALVTRLPVTTPAAVGALVAVTVLVGLIIDQERRWRVSDRGTRTLFLPDEAPGRDSGRTATGKPGGRESGHPDHPGSGQKTKEVEEMAASRVIEEESGTTSGRVHAHNGYYAGDFSTPRYDTRISTPFISNVPA